MDHGRPRFDNMARSHQRRRRRVVFRTYPLPDRAWVFDQMEIGKQKGHSASAPDTVISRLWSLPMRTSLPEFLPMTTSTPSANSCGGINPACAVCYDNSPEQISLSQMISHRKLFSGLTKISAAFEVKRGFPPGFIESRIIAFARTRGVARSWLAWMRSNGRQNRIHRLSIPV